MGIDVITLTASKNYTDKQIEKASIKGADLSGYLQRTELTGAINTALAQAKASGEFKGEAGKDGADGKDYVLTDDDLATIAEQAAELVEVPEGGNVEMKPLTLTGAVNATYDGSEAVSVEIPQGGGATDEQVQNAVGAYLEEHPAQGNVYYNKLFMSYKFTEEDVANYTAGDKFVVKLSGFNGFIKDLFIRVSHPSATGGSVINEFSMICPDPKRKMNNYRSGLLFKNKNIGAWHERAVHLVFAKSSGAMCGGGVENMNGTNSVVCWNGQYWFDPNIVPVDSLGIQLTFGTLVAGLVIELHATEEVEY